MTMYNPPHPGEVLKSLYMESLGISVTMLGRALGVRRATVSALVNGHAGISSNMAIKLAHAFNTTPALWLGIQMEYDLWHAKQAYDGSDVQVLYG